MSNSEQAYRTIKIYISPNHRREDALDHLKYGIEEESVPVEIFIIEFLDALNLAYEAGRASKLEVGIGLDEDSIVLQYGKLKLNEPLFSISSRSPLSDVRVLGSNAARLVKKLPFKSFDDSKGR